MLVMSILLQEEGVFHNLPRHCQKEKEDGRLLACRLYQFGYFWSYVSAW